MLSQPPFASCLHLRHTLTQNPHHTCGSPDDEQSASQTGIASPNDAGCSTEAAILDLSSSGTRILLSDSHVWCYNSWLSCEITVTYQHLEPRLDIVMVFIRVGTHVCICVVLALFYLSCPCSVDIMFMLMCMCACQCMGACLYLCMLGQISFQLDCLCV